MKAIIHKDWLNLKNEMTIRMSHHTIDMSFLLRFYSYVEEGRPVWQHEEKREIILKEQEKTKIWEEYSKKLENRSCANCKRVDKCKLANDVVKNFGTKLKEQCFYCWESK